MSSMRGLRCSECAKEWPTQALAVCPECWGPLQPIYDFDHARRCLTPSAIAARARDMWRYRELLPLDGEPCVGQGTGFTPLLPAPGLGRALGIADLWIKYEAACHPTLSFKDRLVAVALGKARELGLDTVGCASTGNLGHALSAAAARAGFRALVVVPEGVEQAKLLATSVHGATLIGVRGDYDRANRLCTQIADKHGWGFVNVNLRAFYGEGSKTVGFEIAEQRAWSLPGHVVVPMAGGSLIGKLEQAFKELVQLGLVADEAVALHGVQPAGCAPIAAAFKDGLQEPRLVKPDTLVHSLAIGDPADGAAAMAVMRRTSGRAEDPSDAESLAGVRLLAETEGLLAETAGGTVVAAARRLAAGGAFADGRPVVLLITGHGLKTTEALGTAKSPLDVVIGGSLDEFERTLGTLGGVWAPGPA